MADSTRNERKGEEERKKEKERGKTSHDYNSNKNLKFLELIYQRMEKYDPSPYKI